MTDIEGLGYYFHPSDRSHSPGHPGFTVVIEATPTMEHFDPQYLQLPIRAPSELDQSDGVEMLKVHHPWPEDRGEFHVTPGSIIVSDRSWTKVEAFTFGGEMHVRTEEDRTRCEVESPAPILWLFEENLIPMMLAENVEMILAERRAIWHRRQEGFEARLARVQPSALYMACLGHLHTRFGASQHKELPRIQGFLEFIEDEIRVLRADGEWPEEVPAIDELL